MYERLPSMALIIVTGLCFSVCAVVIMLRPNSRAEHAGTQPINYLIDPNQADAATLCLLPGIARGKARLIVEDREVNGAFDSITDLTRVPMIGEKTAAAMAPLLRFNE